MPTATPLLNTPSPRLLGTLLAIAALLSVAMMLHHPVMAGRTAADVVAAAHRSAGLSAGVHGVLLACLLAQWLLLLEFAVYRGIGHWANRSGLSLWSVGTLALAGAALLSGFIAPDIAAAALEDSGALSADEAVAQMRLAHIGNQRLAELGSILLAVAMGAFSLPLLRAPGMPRLVGGFGAGAALLLVVALGSGLLTLDVLGMLLVVIALSVWQLALAAGLIWRRL